MTDVETERAREHNAALTAVLDLHKAGSFSTLEAVGQVNALFAKWFSDKELQKIADMQLMKNNNYIAGNTPRDTTGIPGGVV